MVSLITPPVDPGGWQGGMCPPPNVGASWCLQLFTNVSNILFIHIKD